MFTTTPFTILTTVLLSLDKVTIQIAASVFTPAYVAARKIEAR